MKYSYYIKIKWMSLNKSMNYWNDIVWCGIYGKIITPLVLIYSGHRTGGRHSNAFSIEREGAVHSQFFAIKFKPSGNTEAGPFISTYCKYASIHISNTVYEGCILKTKQKNKTNFVFVCRHPNSSTSGSRQHIALSGRVNNALSS